MTEIVKKEKNLNKMSLALRKSSFFQKTPPTAFGVICCANGIPTIYRVTFDKVTIVKQMLIFKYFLIYKTFNNFP